MGKKTGGKSGRDSSVPREEVGIARTNDQRRFNAHLLRGTEAGIAPPRARPRPGAAGARGDQRVRGLQGTCLGPMLWNAFFADARDPINLAHFVEIIFADLAVKR